MDCIKCGGKTKVIDSRPSELDGTCWWRRRECLECGERFSTYEVLPELIAEAGKAKLKLRKIKNYLETELKGETDD